MQYFCQLLTNPKGSLIHDALISQIELCKKKKQSFISNVYKLLKENDVHNAIPTKQTTENRKLFGKTFKIKLTHSYAEHFKETLQQQNGKLCLYKDIKTNFVMENTCY